MTKGEFLKELRRKLTGEIPPAEVEETLLYYEQYIGNAIKKGKSEQEVLEELGSPLLIARTILDSGKRKKAQAGKPEMEYQEEKGKYEEEKGASFRVYQIPPWAGALILILFLMLALTLLRVLLPILRPLFLIWLIWIMVNNNR